MSNNKIKYYEINYFISYFQIIIISSNKIIIKKQNNYQIKKNMKISKYLNYFFFSILNLI